jgi:hypothetical protein
MTVILQKTAKQAKFDQWLHALRNGDYIQAESALHANDNGIESYCCIGILDEVVYGTEWHVPDIDHEGYFEYVDDEGESTLMSDERVADMDLHKELNKVERKYFENMGLDVEGVITRIAALANANDMGHTFESIADYVEELGWNE